MVDYHSERLTAVFHALADPTRRAMLRQLADGERNVGELAGPFEMTLAAASKHIKALERAGLVRREVRGRIHVCRLDAEPLHGGFEWLRHYERFWNHRLDDLEALLRAEDAAKPPPPASPAASTKSASARSASAKSGAKKSSPARSATTPRPSRRKPRP
ncbi:ArsR/SmtB family transcription factor [Lysobacter enzymogenes]|uniref:ArsR/SmtB family transcription factor n=1 Tax=Lysobacter enzymogenes TaxID=69 RepID=UPI001A958642|nr:metalloregulator ArsR/SmtB family transcription factor [Lysobacter enzymogenes]QQP96838.1 helix-turn-helix transcriptional regulator [Lysobacter enzymogenes]